MGYKTQLLDFRDTRLPQHHGLHSAQLSRREEASSDQRHRHGQQGSWGNLTAKHVCRRPCFLALRLCWQRCSGEPLARGCGNSTSQAKLPLLSWDHFIHPPFL